MSAWANGPPVWLTLLAVGLALFAIARLGTGCGHPEPWPRCPSDPDAYIPAAPGIGETCR